MRYSLLSLVVASTLALTACGNQPAENKDPAKASSATGSNPSAVFTITGAGASFPQPIYAKWAGDFKTATGGQVNYQSIGSSGGIKQIIAKTVDFGATDAPMTKEELDKEGLVQFPTVIGGVVPVVNIDGIKAGQLKLDGVTLANIYLGKIQKWNDPAIVALNAGTTLPDAPITTIFRSDGSGTTYNFTHYLSAVSPDWKAGPGVDKSIKWPTASTGAGAGGKGNEGVASNVMRAKNAIGYVEYAYAKQNNMAYTQLKNSAGNFVQPSAETFAAAGNADWTKTPGFGIVLTNQADPQAWPISAATFILVHKKPANPENVKNTLKFFDWAYTSGDDAAKALDFVPFSSASKATFRDSWKEVVGTDGKPLFESSTATAVAPASTASATTASATK
ncbi:MULTISPECIES: phosphate ABC transporter substrate-binding protein PstS [unclassified Moraxella]|uniref:phosphate ABC transporter substrate-binding protein PstS n=1 Tax=unclassified Moraxella TaxID=2685852 RepID=UPI003AF7AA9C